MQQGQMKLLVTAGGTKEPIDSTRYIGNWSTGQTGLFLTQAFLKAHHNVTLLMANDVFVPDNLCNVATLKRFVTYTHLKELLFHYLSADFFDGVVHLAAVGDYFVSDVLTEDVKLPRKEKITGVQRLTLKLEQNPKLLSQLRDFSRNKHIVVVGFKLTDTDDMQQEKKQVQEILIKQNVDILVHNKLSEVNKDQHIAQVYRNGKFFQKVKDKKNLAKVLLQLLSKRSKEWME